MPTQDETALSQIQVSQPSRFYRVVWAKSGSVTLAKTSANELTVNPMIQKTILTGMISFKGHRFEKTIILTCVRCYLAYPLSYRHLVEMMEERNLNVAPSTIYR